MFHATLIIMSRKYFLGFRSPQLPLDIRFWTRGFPLEIRSRKAGLPFATRSRKRELCFQSYASIITRTENFLNKKFSNFFWKLLQFLFHATLIIMSRKYFFCFPRNILSDRKLSKIFSKFFWKLLLFMFHATLIIMSRKYFLVFKVRTGGFPLMSVNVR